MGNRMKFLTGSRQTSKQKIGKGFWRELKLENKRESRNGPGMSRRARNDATGLGRRLFQRINART